MIGKHRNAAFLFAACFIVGLCWSNFLLTRWLHFFDQRGLMKVFLLIGFSLPFGAAAYGLWHAWVCGYFFRNKKNRVFIWLAGVSLFLSLLAWLLPYSPAPFLTHHTLELVVQGQKNRLSGGEVVRVEQILRPDGATPLPLSEVERVGIWLEDDGALFSDQVGAALRYTSEFKGGLTLDLTQFENAGMVKIVWDGSSQEIDLFREFRSDVKKVVLSESSWGKPETSRAMLAGLFIFGDFLVGLTFIAFVNWAALRWYAALICSLRTLWRILSRARFVFFLLGMILFGINIMGLFLPLRSAAVDHDLEFPPDKLPVSQVYDVINQSTQPVETYLETLTGAIHQGMAHYWDLQEAQRYHLQVPFYHNYLLFLAGYVAPENYYLYQFVDYHKAIDRGVGLCSQQALVVSEILEERQIDSQVIDLQGHVVVTARVKGREWWILDADKGVVLPVDINQAEKNPSAVRTFYIQAGYEETESNRIAALYGMDGNHIYQDTPYLGEDYRRFERWSYILIWLIPGLLCLPFGVTMAAKRSVKNSRNDDQSD